MKSKNQNKKQKKRILIVYQNLEIGGVEKNIVSFLRVFDGKKLEIRLVLMEKKGRLIKQVPKRVMIYDLGLKSKLSWIRQIKGLKQIVEQWKPDAVMTIFDRMTGLAVILRNLYKVKFRLVAVFPNYYSLRFKFIKFGLIRKFLALWFYKQADSIIVRSQACRIDLVKNLGFDDALVKVVRNSSGFRKNQMSQTMGKIGKLFKFVYIGRLTKVKRIKFLLMATKQLLNTDLIKFEVLIVGRGSERSRLEKLAKKLKINKTVKFVGAQEDLKMIYSQAGVLVLPSWIEGCPLVVLEAKHYGLPAIISSFLGAEEIVNHGKDGLIFKLDDINQLVVYMKKLLLNQSFRNKLGLKAKASEVKYSLDNFVDQQTQILLND